MSENKTVKYHIPEQGIYLYARTSDGKTEMIVLNSTDKEQVLPSLTQGTKEGKIITTGKKVNLNQNLTVPANRSLIIEF